MVALTGTINTMDGAYYSHLHMAAPTPRAGWMGGHLNRRW